MKKIFNTASNYFFIIEGSDSNKFKNLLLNCDGLVNKKEILFLEGEQKVVGQDVISIKGGRHLFLFAHSKDYFGKSQSHFEVKNESDESIKNEDSVKHFKDKITRTKYLNVQNCSILWFKHEPSSCTVYSELKEILKSLNGEKSEIEKRLLQIWHKHSTENRDKKRNVLFKILQSNDYTDDILSIIKSCKEWEI